VRDVALLAGWIVISFDRCFLHFPGKECVSKRLCLSISIGFKKYLHCLLMMNKQLRRLSVVVAAIVISLSKIDAFSSSFVQRPALTKLTFSSYSSQRAISMHMGHSHSHHHHDHASSTSPLVSQEGSTFLSRILRFATRRVARFSFAGAAVAGAVYLQKRRVRPSDIGLFLVTALSLSVLDKIKEQVKDWNVRFQEFTKTLEKHATPLFAGDEEERKSRELHRAADQVTYLGVVINLVLSVGKAVTGVLCHSTALIADAGHSLSDLFSDFITLYAVQLGRLPPDDDHPYGHGKFEAVGSLFLALTLIATGLSVGATSAQKLSEILTLSSSTIAAPAILPKRPALIMAALSIVSKEWLYRITKRVGEALNSQVVIANAWHHRSDAYSSILALFSIALAINGWLAADAGAGLIVAGMIALTGVEIMGESIKQLTDTVDETLVQRVEMVLHQAKHHYGNRVISGIQRVRARQVGSSSLVDVSIVTPPNVTNPRALEDELRSKIMKQLPCVIDAEVRVVPKEENEHDPAASQSTTPQSVVEQDVRGEIQKHASVVSVGEVRVGSSGNVDVTIRVDPSSTVQEANGLALQLIDSLQSYETIESARIYLDLNEHISMPIVNSSN
jgi:cation diffusion facilitator family transporter